MIAVIYNCLGGGLTRVATRPDPAVPTGVKEYYVADGLGSTRLVVGNGGVIIDEIEYDPHGRPSTARPVARQTYIGRENDPENGLGDFGVRKYEPSEGRFHSVDPRWEQFRGVSPYVYAQANPLHRVDANGQWDIVVHVSKDRSQNGYGVAVVTNRKGEEIFRFTVRAEGVGNRARYGSTTNPRDRTQQYADTPLGVYDIPDGAGKWRSDQPGTYGPNPRLVLNGQAGEIIASSRTAIRVHGGRQESGTASQLEKTHGCLRAYDNTMKTLKEAVDQLEAEDPEEKGGTLTVVDDLTVIDGVPVIPNDTTWPMGAP